MCTILEEDALPFWSQFGETVTTQIHMNKNTNGKSLLVKNLLEMLGAKGVQKGPKGVQGRPKDYENGPKIDSLRKPCKEQATAGKTSANSFEKLRKLEGKPKGKPGPNRRKT